MKHFKLDLVSNNQIVLVEYPGVGKELFIPSLVKDKIILKNIIRERRCCHTPRLSAKSKQFADLISPLAKSTPNRLTNELNLLNPEYVRSVEETSQKVPYTYDINVSSIDKSSNSLALFGNSSPIRNDCKEQQIVVLTDSKSDLTDEANDNTIQWSKCKIPKRTYARKEISTTTNNIVVKKKNSSTKGPVPEMILNIRKRKIIIDKKKSLQPKDFNRPLKLVIKENIQKNTAAARTRKQYEALKSTAFDLLTTSHCCKNSSKLHKQFRSACINKAVSTHPTYMDLAILPPLHEDTEINRLHREMRV